MTDNERYYNVWVVVRPAPDLPGQWLAHCLEFDVVSQGDSPWSAIKMADEAVQMVVLDELNRGRDPLERRAPENFFGELYGLFERGEKLSKPDLDRAVVENRIVLMATQFELRFHRVTAIDDAPLSMRPTNLSIAQATC